MEVKIGQATGFLMLSVDIDRRRATWYGLNMSDVRGTAAIAIGGEEAGTSFQDD